MNREKRLRRVALLCCHFVRNCAYYRSVNHIVNQTKVKSEFWCTVQNNFMDIAVLEWLKLFGDHDDKHHWKKVVTDSQSFKQKMFDTCEISERDLIQSRESFKLYRDKFVAHLDSEEIMYIPVLDVPLILTKFYYRYITNELRENRLQNLPVDIENYYQECLQVAQKYFVQ